MFRKSVCLSVCLLENSRQELLFIIYSYGPTCFRPAPSPPPASSGIAPGESKLFFLLPLLPWKPTTTKSKQKQQQTTAPYRHQQDHNSLLGQKAITVWIESLLTRDHFLLRPTPLAAFDDISSSTARLIFPFWKISNEAELTAWKHRNRVKLTDDFLISVVSIFFL